MLRVLSTRPMHGYAIAQRIAQISGGELSVEEGSLYPALQKMLLKGWVRATPTISESGRTVREYQLTRSGEKQLELEQSNYQRLSKAIHVILETA